MTEPRHSRPRAALCCVALVLGTSAGALAEPTGALPNTQAPPIRLSPPVALNLADPLPGNGAIIIQTMAGAQTIVQLTQSSTSSALIEGTLTPLGALWIWKPYEPLVPAAYGLTLVNPSTGAANEVAGHSSYAFTVSESWTPEVPALTSTPSASAIDDPLETACCRVRSGDALVESSVCLTTRATTRLQVMANLTSAAPEQLDQFLYRARPEGTPPDPEPTGFQLGRHTGGALFDAQAEEYCFEIDAIDIVSGEVHTDVAVEPRCIAHGTLPALEAHPVEVSDDLLHRSVCAAPPPSFEARWCALNELECEAMPLACPLFANVCRGEALPPLFVPPVLTGGTSGMIDAQPQPHQPHASSGCSTTRRTSTAPLFVWMALAYGLVWGLRRRRER